MSSPRDHGSALIEAVVIGSVVFLIVLAATGSAIRVAVRGGEVTEAARVAAVHAARHDDVEAALDLAGSLFPDFDVDAGRTDGSIFVAAGAGISLPHLDGIVYRYLVGRAEMPLAPFRSDRG